MKKIRQVAGLYGRMQQTRCKQLNDPEDLTMKKLLVTAIIALASTSALAFDSRFDAQEYYT